MLGEEKLHEIWDDLSKAPKEHTESAFAVDFWYLVKGTQGKGEFVRSKSQIHRPVPGIDVYPIRSVL